MIIRINTFNENLVTLVPNYIVPTVVWLITFHRKLNLVSWLAVSGAVCNYK